MISAQSDAASFPGTFVGPVQFWPCGAGGFGQDAPEDGHVPSCSHAMGEASVQLC